ncbi:glycosyltransferase [Mesorhizobium sp. J18]|uniref:glycosyltransferase family 2 protein n=1 Tax=Mesorhizobium sp. J18 TaxID=935263 RepID=UPI001FEDF405|nr:glycosyltransferase [Mesorhizobium sp. J18]
MNRLSVSCDDARAIAAHAEVAGTSFHAELLAAGLVGERDLFREAASELGLPFLHEVDPEKLIVDERACLAALRRHSGMPFAIMLEAPERNAFLLTPDGFQIGQLRSFLQRCPDERARLRITPPSALRQALIARSRPALARMAKDRLFNSIPQFSARYVVNAWQGAVLGMALIGLPTCFLLFPTTTTLLLHSCSSLLFLACVVLRLAASASAKPLRLPPLKATPPSEMPTYTVLVALYKEAEIVPDLITALSRLVWPRGKLEIKLVCEADDAETLAAIRSQTLGSYMEVIEVPPGGPRTKPKALSYALPMTSGEYVVLYDAEDRPHPFQLIEAWQRFQSEGAELACLQAPLVISNRRESMIAAMFGLEYAGLFRGMLPWLARRNLVLPLGGTSNHFLRSVLENVGGWDPCNVTEDADLGLRLKRFGYRVGTIHYPTYEDAPTDIRTWLPQRTRWLKGWMQTWFVHMRDPAMLARDLGPFSFIVAQILTAGMIVSALIHPVFLATVFLVVGRLVLGMDLSATHSALLVIDSINISCGYTAFLVLGWRTLGRAERKGFWKLVPFTAIYWMLISVAAWQALWQLYRRPHHWAKTPHWPSRRLHPAINRGNPGPSR